MRGPSKALIIDSYSVGRETTIILLCGEYPVPEYWEQPVGSVMGKHLWLSLALACSAILLNQPVAEAKAFKNFQGKQCNRDYKRLCPMIPIGKCDLESMIEQLSLPCKAFVEKHR